ncbi:hypothetical protein [Capnocytophaga catalasegens]|uniref:CYTH domain-containing protein n=1 Tax=Capnocytophaga catalasegens TaxID=1004260 RepID=A0AAV5B0E7_9FLAO|nr:hypothetical protein [Capnocytophaga catalasegens]GIZ15276.1 hypothetical protein RCZ03_12760 [Capnocytophaga catalasegens]GJM51396.1 hypothetical protein RCZ15_23690 [Capnocytophaga catalasegens]GJM54204.1 hypothetical protein RCZ16_25200 [Capnocytophaga catalasegens]
MSNNTKRWQNIDFEKLVGLLLPTFLRKRKMLAWLRMWVAPLKSLHYDFFQKRNALNGDLYRLAHNGQVCYLRKMLNDNFDPEKRRIRILDGNKFRRKYIYTRGENKPIYLGKMYLRGRSDYADTGVDFIVEIPKEVSELHRTEQNGAERFYAIEAYVDFYRLAGKRYKIVSN